MAARACALAALAALAVARTPSDPTPIAASIDGLADYTHTMPFVDVRKQSRVCGSPQAPYDGKCARDALGWPLQDFGLVIITTDYSPPPPQGTGIVIAGVYSIYATGNATVALSSSVKGYMINQTYDAATNTLTAFANCTSQGGNFWLSFYGTSRDPVHTPSAGGLTAVRVLQPGYDLSRADDFTDAFLSLVSRFDTLRFMDWRATNGNPETVWANRSVPHQATYAVPKGIPWEVCAQLANRVGRDMWINIPAMADDEYVIQLGLLLAPLVDPSLNIYYEYSNEVWNYQFSQAHYAVEQANASVTQQGDPHNFNYDACNNEYYWQWRRTAYEAAVRIPSLFAQGFGKGNIGPGKRVRPLLSMQACCPFVMTNALEYVHAVMGPPGMLLHGIAVAPYFNLGPANDDPTLDTSGVLAAMAANAQSQSPAAGMGVPNAVHAALAAYHGLQLRAYEGGPDTSCPYSGPNNGCSPSNLIARANSSIDPRLTAIIEGYLTDWYSWGQMMGPLNYFVAGATPLLDKYGVYGLLYDMTVQVTPKSIAVDDVRKGVRPPPASALPSLPTPFLNATLYAGHPVPITQPCLEYMAANTTFLYLFRVTVTGTLRVTLTTATVTAGLPVEVTLSSLPSSSPITLLTQAGNYYPPGPFINTTSASFPSPVQANSVVALRIRVLVTRGYSIGGLILEVTP